MQEDSDQIPLILIDKKPSTSKIKSIRSEGFYYRIAFHRSNKIFRYGSDRITILNNREQIDPTHTKIYYRDKEITNIASIQRFKFRSKSFWRIDYDGKIREFDGDEIKMVRSCLGDKRARDIFEYLKSSAAVNPLLATEEEPGLLYSLYDRCRFIDDSTAAYPYLNPDTRSITKTSAKQLIFPFGINASQKQAVTQAFKNQLSVIQGPPGTGKTQTILNIIANIILQGGSVLVVSNNNSAISNVLQKLQKQNFDFFVALLGKKENKELFIENQPQLPDSINTWGINSSRKIDLQNRIYSSLEKLQSVFSLQNKLASLKQEYETIKIEWEHFKAENNLTNVPDIKGIRGESTALLKTLLRWQTYLEERESGGGFYKKILLRIRERRLLRIIKRTYLIEVKSIDPVTVTIKLQTLFYRKRRGEIEGGIKEVESKLSKIKAEEITKEIVKQSAQLFEATLYEKYYGKKRALYCAVDEIKRDGEAFLQQYPVILSTTFSARNCLFGKNPYDFVIMDEASQVSVETGVLALTCARNAVIVGDSLQLPNVITNEDKVKLDAVRAQYDVPMEYDCSSNSFLKSICTVINDIPQTLLREHYRCHPKIINFCNQKFYRGELLIMTEDHGEPDVLCAYKTVPGNHASNHWNQREIDVIKEEVLPKLSGTTDIGIVTPYNNQVAQFISQLPQIESATVHKFQGREKDCIIMSVVANQITTFCDDPNLLNVAVSRAKKNFYLVVSGNEQKKQGNITDLIDYITYTNGSVCKSQLHSIFDYLYSQYTKELLAIGKKQKKISRFASENLTYDLINRIIKEDDQLFGCLMVLCHMPLRNIFRNKSLLSEEELKYVNNFNSHVDFLIVNRVSKKPVLAIETDGFSYHNKETKQHKRDIKKNHIFYLYNLPLLRLSTKGSNEEERVREALLCAMGKKDSDSDR